MSKKRREKEGGEGRGDWKKEKDKDGGGRRMTVSELVEYRWGRAGRQKKYYLDRQK